MDHIGKEYFKAPIIEANQTKIIGHLKSLEESISNVESKLVNLAPVDGKVDKTKIDVENLQKEVDALKQGPKSVDEAFKEFLIVKLDQDDTLNGNSSHYIGKDFECKISRFRLF